MCPRRSRTDIPSSGTPLPPYFAESTTESCMGSVSSDSERHPQCLRCVSSLPVKCTGRMPAVAAAHDDAVKGILGSGVAPRASPENSAASSASASSSANGRAMRSFGGGGAGLILSRGAAIRNSPVLRVSFAVARSATTGAGNCSPVQWSAAFGLVRSEVRDMSAMYRSAPESVMLRCVGVRVMDSTVVV